MIGLKIYSKDNCKPCITLKYWLDKKGIEYQEEDINQHIPRLVEKGFMSAPVVELDGKFVSGVNLTGVAELLNV